MIEQNIQKGFNGGYYLKAHAPALAEKFAKALTNKKAPYAIGFIAGIKQREKEILVSKGKNYDISNISKSSNQKDNLWPFSIRSASRYVKDIMTKEEIDGIKSSALGLRHGFAVHVLTKIPITKVQKWLGHASLQTTAIYLNVSGEEERALAQKLWVMEHENIDIQLT